MVLETLVCEFGYTVPVTRNKHKKKFKNLNQNNKFIGTKRIKYKYS